jgi:predicted ATP-binding protein involved in virulence
MKIDYLKIKSQFKNLNKVEIDFAEQELMTVVVGWNGAGKSNVIEALASIFSKLDYGDLPEFAYEIKYRLGDIKKSKNNKATWVKVVADPKSGDTPAKQYKISASESGNSPKNENWKEVALSKVIRDREGRSDYLPRHVFAYYSGTSDRLEKYFKKHRTDFYRKLLYRDLDIEGEIRPLFYAKPIHSQFVLLAFFLGDSDSHELAFLNNYLGIESLDSVHFVLRRPDWFRSENRDELFWGADGVVRDFLDRLFPHTLAPIKITRNEDTSLTGTNVKNEFFHLFLPDLESLRNLAGSLSSDVFFKMCESTLLSEIISEVRVRVKLRNVDEPLSFAELSEGEQQLLTVLGLLKFTGGKDSLFLLDEPDTHLNPLWTVKYLSFLKDFIPNQNTSHMIMITHHPLALAELPKEQVQIMFRDSEGIVQAVTPEIDPRGMGYAGILTSDMFGLGSTLDEPTTNLIRQRRAFIEKKKLTDQEANELSKLTKQLDELGFSTAHWDADYQEYLQIRRKEFDEIFHDDQRESPDIIKKRHEKAQEIIKRILQKKKKDGE